ncbi:MAG: hypothetical protein ACNS64_05875 [Candidatus Halalkalibacterium sp. M3_1C_030]
MKLLIILSIEEYANDVRMILAKQRVPVYSETEIHGFRTEAYQPDLSNWFASDAHGVYSKLFFTFHQSGSVKGVMEEVQKYNDQKGDDQQNPVHAYLVDVEQSV